MWFGVALRMDTKETRVTFNDEHNNLHCDNELDIHMSSRTY